MEIKPTTNFETVICFGTGVSIAEILTDTCFSSFEFRRDYGQCF